MDTPAFTPETLSSPDSSPPTHKHPQHHHQPTTTTKSPHSAAHHNTTTTSTLTPPTMPPSSSTSSFFANALRPLSPPETPFGFNAAFPTAKPPPDAMHVAPASPHFGLPGCVVKRVPFSSSSFSSEEDASVPRKPRPVAARGWARGVLPDSKRENPYFPSVGEQRRAERWVRDAPALRLVRGEDSMKEGELCAVAAVAAASSTTMASGHEEDEDEVESGRCFALYLAPERRRRRGGVALLPASPVSLPCANEAPPVAAVEYSRGMAVHLRERMQRGSVARRRPAACDDAWGARDFAW